MECLLLKVTPSVLVHTFEHLSVCSIVHWVAFSKHNIGYDNLFLFVNSPCFLGPSHCHLVKRDAVVPWFETMFKTLPKSVQIKFMECLLLKVTPSILVHTFEHLSVCSVVHWVAFSKHNIGCDNLLLFVNSPCFLGPSHCHLVKRDAVVPWFETMFKTLLNSAQIKFMECLLLKVTPSILVHTFNRAFIGMFYCSLSCLSKHNIGYDNLLLFVNSHCFLGPKWKQKKQVTAMFFLCDMACFQ